MLRVSNNSKVLLDTTAAAGIVCERPPGTPETSSRESSWSAGLRRRHTCDEFRTWIGLNGKERR
jgi:hypothetical protein